MQIRFWRVVVWGGGSFSKRRQQHQFFLCIPEGRLETMLLFKDHFQTIVCGSTFSQGAGGKEQLGSREHNSAWSTFQLWQKK